jgi:hypothetical protein
MRTTHPRALGMSWSWRDATFQLLVVLLYLLVLMQMAMAV